MIRFVPVFHICFPICCYTFHQKFGLNFILGTGLGDRTFTVLHQAIRKAMRRAINCSLHTLRQCQHLDHLDFPSSAIALIPYRPMDRGNIRDPYTKTLMIETTLDSTTRSSENCMTDTPRAH